MLDFNAPEFLVVAIVALLVIGPKDLPKAMRVIGKWVGKARGVARQFRSGIDTMMRESELAEMEKQWAAENERIMREHPPTALPPPPQAALAAGPPAEVGEDAGPLMVEQPLLRSDAGEVTVIEAEAPKARKPRKPRAKAES